MDAGDGSFTREMIVLFYYFIYYLTSSVDPFVNLTLDIVTVLNYKSIVCNVISITLAKLI